MTSIFIYYRVAARDWHETETLVRSMQARLACRTGIRGRLLKKQQEPGLWMEIYESVPQTAKFERHLAEVEAEFDIDMFLESPRHREIFDADPLPVIIC